MKKSLLIKLAGSVIGVLLLIVLLVVPLGGFPGLGGLLSPIGGVWNGSNYANYPEYKEIKGSGHSGLVYRDELGIPHIFATTFEDSSFMIGYLQATDRLFSMDMQRRMIAGRLSEVLGPSSLGQDKYMRLMGFARSGSELWDKILEDAPFDPELQLIVDSLNAYCDGVNKYIDEIMPNKLPLEYVFLGLQPEEWTPLDILAFLKFESYALSFTEYDLLMTLIKDKMGADTVDELVPYETYIFEEVVIPNFETNESGGTPKIKKGVGLESGFDQSSLDDISEYSEELENIYNIFQNFDAFGLKKQIIQACSNNWVVNGSLSYSGKPILCNDPHLQLMLPSVWWEFQLTNSTPGADESVYGVSFPGAPIAEIGHTGYIAWGCTVTAYDQNDFYHEKLTPNGTKYLFNNSEWREVETVNEDIQIKGQSDYHYKINFTRHNLTEHDDFKCPIIDSSEWDYPGGLNLSIKWTGFADDYGIIKGLFRLNKAKNISDYLDSLEEYSYPGQNFVFGDVDGNIALYPAAQYPVRNATGTVKQGKYILNGSNGEDEWTGYIPFDWIPHKINPDQMFLASANQRTVNTTEYTKYYTSYAFASSYRGRRINQILRNISKHNEKITIERMKEIQTDYYDIGAQEFVPRLLDAFDNEHPTGVPDSGEWKLINQSIEKLKDWNKSKNRWIMDKDLIAPTIFDTWLQIYGYFTFLDEMENASLNIANSITLMLIDFLENITRFNPTSPWFDNITSTGVVENASDMMLIALNETMDRLTLDLGNFSNWHWGNYHIMDIRYLEGMMPEFDYPQYGCSGSGRTINVAGGQYVHSGPSMRMIVDFEALTNGSIYSGYLTFPGGQSGNYLSEHYDDNYQYWKENEYHPILFPRSIDEYPTDQIYSTVIFS
ncbi:MAG: hypothetical protein GF329_05045 [Candidatus Lokiarchaeota archaeon]|nr:hypothetical protein [Candidatus Lokiarchaeota archaeon]